MKNKEVTWKDVLVLHRVIVQENKPSTRLMRRYPYRICGDRADLKRFVRVFREAWRQVPLSERRCLLAHWELQEPRFFLLDTITNNGTSRGSIATCYLDSGRLVFLKDAVELMPDSILQILIAHELAHISHRLQWKEESPEMFAKGLVLFWDLELEKEGEGPLDELHWKWSEEMDTRELCEMWGFPDEELADWVTANHQKLADFEIQRMSEIEEWGRSRWGFEKPA